MQRMPCELAVDEANPFKQINHLRSSIRPSFSPPPFCNQGVAGSIPAAGTRSNLLSRVRNKHALGAVFFQDPCQEPHGTDFQAEFMSDARRRFEAQVLPHLDAAYRFARWLAPSSDHADDVVQDAMLRAFRGF